MTTCWPSAGDSGRDEAADDVGAEPAAKETIILIGRAGQAGVRFAECAAQTASRKKR